MQSQPTGQKRDTTRRTMLSRVVVTTWAALFGTQTLEAVEVADLQEELENGLRARGRDQLAFIGRVCQFVENGRLPVAMVKASFQWSRPKKPHPFPYFQRAIRRQARGIGVQL